MSYPTIRHLTDRTLVGDECWLWTGVVNPNGYGQLSYRLDGRVRNVYAHRLAYELLVGPIPAGLSIDHLCRNLRCVRPSHLEPCTISENQRRGGLARTADAPEPPPAKRRGQNVNRRGGGRAHGHESTYCAGCRCDLCKSAHTVNARRRRAEQKEAAGA